MKIPKLNEYKIIRNIIIKKKDYSLKEKIIRYKLKLLTKKFIRSYEIVYLFSYKSHPYLITRRINSSSFKLLTLYGVKSFKNYIKIFSRINGIMEAYSNDPYYLLAKYYRIRNSLAFLPYIPSHVSYIKEIKYVLLFNLPKKGLLNIVKIPINASIAAIPFYEIFENIKFNFLIRSIPLLSCKYLKFSQKKHVSYY